MNSNEELDRLRAKIINYSFEDRKKTVEINILTRENTENAAKLELNRLAIAGMEQNIEFLEKDNTRFEEENERLRKQVADSHSVKVVVELGEEIAQLKKRVAEDKEVISQLQQGLSNLDRINTAIHLERKEAKRKLSEAEAVKQQQQALVNHYAERLREAEARLKTIKKCYWEWKHLNGQDNRLCAIGGLLWKAIRKTGGKDD